MSDVPDLIYPRETTAVESTEAAKKHPTDRPMPLWPEGFVAIGALAALVFVGLRHRVWLQRKFNEAKRAADEFQKHGGTEEISQLARMAGDFFKR